MKRIISTCLSFLMLNSVMISTSLAIDPPFSQAEDQKLTKLVSEYGESNWELIASLMENRTTRQCRERWKNCLSCPKISTPFTPEEDNLLKQKYQKIGPHWSEINKFFKDKSDVQLKNRYNLIKKKKEDEVVAQQEATQNDDVLTGTIDSTCLDNLPNYEVFDNESFSLETNTSIGENFLSRCLCCPIIRVPFTSSEEDKLIEQVQLCLDRYCSSGVSKKEILQLCNDVTKVLKKEDSLLKIYITNPTIVVGDLHGDIKALKYCCRKYFLEGIRENQTILFLGDYVDRGKHGIEVIASLFKLKTMFPGSVFLLRGNHEEIGMNRAYGFSEECSLKYGQLDGNNVLERINNTFNYLSLAAVVINRTFNMGNWGLKAVDNNTFCVHGGISPKLDINQINDIQKPYSASSHKATPLVNDLLWSDPDKSIEDFGQNQRGVGQKYGADVTKDFLKRNELKRIIRAHEVAEAGFEDVFGDGSVITVFSSPGYQEGINSGALALVTGNANDDIEYETYTTRDLSVEE